MRPLATLCEGRAFNLRYLKLWSHWALRYRTTTCHGRSLADRGPSGWIVRNRAMLYDVAAIDEPMTTSWRFFVIFQNLVAMPDIVEYRTIIARRRANSLDVMRRRGCLYHIFTCSHDVVPWSCDILRHRTKSHNHRMTVIVFRCWLQLLGRQS